jgi:hypothetical protein
MEGPGLELENGVLSGKGKSFDLRIHSLTKQKAENGELYPVFPFRLYGLGHGTEDIVLATMENRTSKNSFDYKCWTQDQIHWAYSGDANEARDGLIHRFRHASTQCRFPLYGSQGPDSCPDFDHFGAGSTALQGSNCICLREQSSAVK